MKDSLSAVRANMRWFRESGVMIPASGEWGVAERVAVLAGNSSAEQILRTFPAWTLHGDCAIVEQRRSDCCFEAALLFLLAAEVTGSAEDRKTAENILDFLYFRSGLLNRSYEGLPAGVWNWTHICWCTSFWFDDNGWVAALQILIGLRYPELDRKYQCVQWGTTLARELLTAFNRTFDPARLEEPENVNDPEKQFAGKLSLPHWGMPPVCAFLAAYVVEKDPVYREPVKRYADYVLKRAGDFNSSELSYALIGMPLAAELFPEEPVFAELCDKLAANLVGKAASSGTGNLPAEHYETPNGAHLVDTIYTANWALLGFVNLAGWSKRPEHWQAAHELAQLLTDIQDTSGEPAYRGCWRGMFDLKAGTWGGGNCYEGGAGSIYTGWTNAPIAIGLLLAAENKSFADLIKQA